jgi:hypothetical protein
VEKREPPGGWHNPWFRFFADFCVIIRIEAISGARPGIDIQIKASPALSDAFLAKA